MIDLEPPKAAGCRYNENQSEKKHLIFKTFEGTFSFWFVACICKNILLTANSDEEGCSWKAVGALLSC